MEYQSQSHFSPGRFDRLSDHKLDDSQYDVMYCKHSHGASTGSATVNSATDQVRRTQAGRTDGLKGRAGGNGGIVGNVGIVGISGIVGIMGIGEAGGVEGARGRKGAS